MNCHKKCGGQSTNPPATTQSTRMLATCESSLCPYASTSKRSRTVSDSFHSPTSTHHKRRCRALEKCPNAKHHHFEQLSISHFSVKISCFSEKLANRVSDPAAIVMCSPSRSDAYDRLSNGDCNPLGRCAGARLD